MRSYSLSHGSGGRLFHIQLEVCKSLVKWLGFQGNGQFQVTVELLLSNVISGQEVFVVRDVDLLLVTVDVLNREVSA